METSLALLLLFGALLIVSTLCLLVLRHLSQAHERAADRYQTIIAGYERLSDKTAALLVSRDALAYQSVQLSDYGRYDASEGESYDPSDEAEMERIRRRAGEDDLNGPERAAAAALDDGDFFAPGF
jgi:hypothetical protein